MDTLGLSPLPLAMPNEQPDHYCFDARYIAYWRDKVLIDQRKPHRPAQLYFDQTGDIGHHLQPLYLGQVQGRSVFSVDLFEDFAPHPPEPYTFRALHELPLPIGTPFTSAVTAGFQLSQWMRHNQYCPRCGSQSLILAQGHGRECANPECRQITRPSPALTTYILPTDSQGRLAVARHSVGLLRSTQYIAYSPEAQSTIIQRLQQDYGLVIELGQALNAPASLMLEHNSCAYQYPVKAKIDGMNQHLDWVEPLEYQQQLNQRPIERQLLQALSDQASAQSDQDNLALLLG